MNERNEQFSELTYDEKAYGLSKYADEIILGAQRQRHGEAGLPYEYENLGVSYEVAGEAELQNFFIARLIDPPNSLYIGIIGPGANQDQAQESRTLGIIISSNEVETEYNLNYRPLEAQPVRFVKNVVRVYGERAYDRYGQLSPDSVMIEPVAMQERVSDGELEVLYEVLRYASNRLPELPA